MFPNDPNNTSSDNPNQNNNSAQSEFNQVPQQPNQPATDQFQQPSQPQLQQAQQPLNQQSANQLPPEQIQQPQPTQPSSFNPMQQMGYQEPAPKKKRPNALLLTIVFIALLIVGVVVAMVLISGKSKAPTATLSTPNDGTVTTSQPTDDSQAAADPNAPQILDTTAVVQDFYDNYLTALRAKSQPKQWLNVLHTYVKSNQDLTPSYQKQLSKTTSTSQDPLLFGKKFLPGNINYGDPVAKKGDSKTATLPVIVPFGSTNQVIKVTLTWQTAQARAGYWQIAKVTK